MTMTFEQLGALGELIGAVASVVLLAYIAIQIRQNWRALEHNTRAAEAASRQAFAAQDQAYLCSALDSTVLAVAVSKLEAGEDLSALERSQLVGRQHVNFRVFETAFSQFRKGVLDAKEWERYQRIIAFLLSGDEPAQEMWLGLRDVFDADFTEEVERLGGGLIAGHDPNPITSGTGVRRSPS